MIGVVLTFPNQNSALASLPLQVFDCGVFHFDPFFHHAIALQHHIILKSPSTEMESIDLRHSSSSSQAADMRAIKNFKQEQKASSLTIQSHQRVPTSRLKICGHCHPMSTRPHVRMWNETFKGGGDPNFGLVSGRLRQ